MTALDWLATAMARLEAQHPSRRVFGQQNGVWYCRCGHRGESQPRHRAERLLAQFAAAPVEVRDELAGLVSESGA